MDNSCVQTEANVVDHGAQFDKINKGGLGTTRFGKGFARKYETSIQNPTKDCLAEIAKETEVKKETLRQSRSDFLKTVDTYNGFNPVNNQPRTESIAMFAFLSIVDVLHARITSSP